MFEILSAIEALQFKLFFAVVAVPFGCAKSQCRSSDATVERISTIREGQDRQGKRKEETYHYP